MKTDAELFFWLAQRCFYPEDHPKDSICVLVPESISKHGSFLLDPDHDANALRVAINNQIEMEKSKSPN